MKTSPLRKAGCANTCCKNGMVVLMPWTVVSASGRENVIHVQLRLDAWNLPTWASAP